jgi:poly(ADP-ribose) glycohydrolase ARH3
MGVAETLVASGRLDPEALVRNLARNCDVGRGYGMGTRRALEAATRGQDWQSVRYTSWPSGSKGNGGAVRVAPIACFYAGDPGALVDAADASAVVTHAHIEARTGARLFALATAHALRSPSPEGLGASELLASLRGHAARVPKYVRRLDDIKALLQQPSVSAEEAARTIGHRVLAVESVSLALYAFLRWHTSFEEAVINAIALGGDTDSIGAMTGSMAGALHGVRAIPARWLSCLENGPRGRDYAVLLAERLFDASTSHHKNG